MDIAETRQVGKIVKINESYSYIDAPLEVLKEITDILKVEKPDAYNDPKVKAGLVSKYEYFTSYMDGKLLIMNGHLDILDALATFNLERSTEPSQGFSESTVHEYLDNVKRNLKFPPYEFQEFAFLESMKNSKQINKMCTSSGKSMTISLIADFLRTKGKKGLLLVPNIGLLAQFKDDIKDYNLNELYEDTHLIGGGDTDRHFNSSLTISTWQSLMEYHHLLDEIDFLVVDECHRFTSAETSTIVKKTENCKIKLAFTGSLPESKVGKMNLLGMFGNPKKIISSKELIDLGLATPVVINSLILNYSKEDKAGFRSIKDSKIKIHKYQKQVTFIKEHEGRQNLITNLSCKLKTSGNTLVLFQHTDHGKDIFTRIMKKLHPDVEVKNKDITGKKSFEFQSKFGVFFLNGEDDKRTRELTRKILEEREDAILVANYALLSTGVNIKRLYNMVFASPMKSYTTITQSIGRLMRQYPGKTKGQVFDIVDNFGLRGVNGPFVNQYKHRVKMSYNSEEHPIKETHVEMQ